MRERPCSKNTAEKTASSSGVQKHIVLVLQVKPPYNLRPRQSKLQDKVAYNLRPRKSKQLQGGDGERTINDLLEEQPIPRGLTETETSHDLEKNKLPPKKRWAERFLIARNGASSQESTTIASFNDIPEYLSSVEETDQRQTYVFHSSSPGYGSNFDA